MAVFAGRGDHQQLNRTYSLGIAGTVLFALIFIALGLMLAEPLTMIFGGALNPAMAAQAALYLRAGCVCILVGALDAFLSKILALYGLQKYVFRSAFISMLSNIAFSILFIRLLPDRLAITGLGAGTAIGGLMACLSSFHALKKQKVPLRFKIKNVQLNKLPEIMKLGFPTSANKLADNLVAGIINNLIVAASGVCGFLRHDRQSPFPCRCHCLPPVCAAVDCDASVDPIVRSHRKKLYWPAVFQRSGFHPLSDPAGAAAAFHGL